MTDEEREKRNPKLELAEFRLEDYPELHVSDLELRHVYILIGPSGNGATLRYMGKALSLDPRTLDVLLTHHFHGSRIGFDICLVGQEDGTLQDGEGNKIIVLKYPCACNQCVKILRAAGLSDLKSAGKRGKKRA